MALPQTIRSLQVRWKISLEKPFQHSYVSCSWVAPATLPDGTRAVLKVGMPHMEAEQEVEGLRFWNGDGTVKLLKADHKANAMLLERCEPGDSLLSIPETEQDLVITTMLRRLWKKPTENFRPLSALIAHWTKETLSCRKKWSDSALVTDGLQTFAILAVDAGEQVLLATDLHAGNVLRAQREPWLMIDPKPFAGDAAYDLTQHLINCEQRLQSDPDALIGRVSDLAQVDSARVRKWLFARTAAEPRENWDNWKLAVARKIAPCGAMGSFQIQ